MSEQRSAPKSAAGGTRRGAQAVAGVAGAVACLGIGWAVGVRSADTQAPPPSATTRNTQPSYLTIPSGWSEDDGPAIQWGTVPGTGLVPAQPGTGTVAPSTASGGSTVAAAAVTTNAVNATTANGTTGGLP